MRSWYAFSSSTLSGLIDGLLGCIERAMVFTKSKTLAHCTTTCALPCRAAHKSDSSRQTARPAARYLATSLRPPTFHQRPAPEDNDPNAQQGQRSNAPDIDAVLKKLVVIHAH